MTDTVGQKLIQARKERGVTLEDAARSTRIRVYYLQALEADDLASLPSPAHFRGFLRLYAGYLGLDPAEFLPTKTLPRSIVRQPVIKAPSKGQNKKRTDPGKKIDQGDQKDIQPEQDESALTRGKDEVQPLSQTKIIPEENKPGVEPAVLEINPDEEPVSPSPPSGIAEKAVNPPPLIRKTVSPARSSQYPPLEPEDGKPKTSQEMFIEIGSLLRKRRESLSLTMDEVERFTHLRLHHLKTLENGHMEDLASPVQARGMLSNYARFLNLDDEKLLLEYANALQTRRMERVNSHSKIPQAKKVSRPGIGRFISLDLVAGILLIIAMAAFLVWGLSQVMNSQNQAAIQSTLPPVSEVLAVSPTDTPGLNTPPAPASTDSLLPSGTQGGPDANPTSDNSTSAGAPVTGGATGGQGPVTSRTPSSNGKSNAEGPIQVYIIAKNSAWVKVTVDGQTAFMGRVVPGNAYTYNANKKLEVLTGDASALQVLYNQSDLGNLGVLDQVIDLIFTDKGQVYPTPTITPTPTKVLTATNGPSPTGTPLRTGTPPTTGFSAQTNTTTPSPAATATVK